MKSYVLPALAFLIAVLALEFLLPPHILATTRMAEAELSVTAKADAGVVYYTAPKSSNGYESCAIGAHNAHDLAAQTPIVVEISRVFQRCVGVTRASGPPGFVGESILSATASGVLKVACAMAWLAFAFYTFCPQPGFHRVLGILLLLLVLRTSFVWSIEGLDGPVGFIVALTHYFVGFFFLLLHSVRWLYGLLSSRKNSEYE